MNADIWQSCLRHLEGNLKSSEFSTWIHPLQAKTDKSGLTLLAPNAIVRNWVSRHYFNAIEAAVRACGDGEVFIRVEVSEPDAAEPPARSPGVDTVMPGAAAAPRGVPAAGHNGVSVAAAKADPAAAGVNGVPARMPLNSRLPAARSAKAVSAAQPVTRVERDLVPEFTFENFVQGPSNRLAFAHAQQIARVGWRMNSGHNPLVICGGVGLGKTHLMHAAGNELCGSQPDMNIVYCCAEDFVNSMLSAIRLNDMPEFKRYYRSAQVLLIDDIQFFADKEASQEELFHTVDTLLQRSQQIIITCDRQPREIEGLHARLRSRFGHGLTIVIEQPDLETRAAILMQKAAVMKLDVPEDCALFIARELRSNVRELMGALNRVAASAGFYGRPITLDLVQEALADILAVHNRQVRMQDIKIKVAEHFNIRVSLLHSPTRVRNIVRARQLAMFLARELTSESLPSIGDAFGGRDHTTVIHACKQIAELRRKDQEIERAYSTLHRLLTA